MDKNYRICKTCGTQYKACLTPNPGVFRWRDVACSPECAMKYLERVEASRGVKPVQQEAVPAVEHEVATAVETHATEAEPSVPEEGTVAVVAVSACCDYDDDEFEDELDDECEDEE